MEAEIKQTGPCRRVLEVRAGWDDVKEDYEEVLAEYLQAGIPGFRPGKAPAGIIERRFSKELVEEAANRCTRRLFHQAVEEHGLGLVGLVEIPEIELVKDEGLSFNAELEVAPEFDMPDFRSFRKDGDGDPRDQLSRYLLDNAPMPVPGSLTEEELRSADAEPVDTRDEEQRREAEDRVRLLLILNRIAREEGIDVDERGVDERIETMAGEYGLTPAQLRAELEPGGGLRRLRTFLLVERTLDYILELTAGK